MSMFKSVDVLKLNSTLATGAAASSDITVTGIATEDTIIAALELSQTHYLPTDQTRRCTITDTNDVQCSKTTENDKVWILWNDESGEGIECPCLQWVVVDGAAASTNMAISGIATEDTLLAVMALADTTAAWTDDLAQCSITSAGNIQSTTDNSTATLLVLWHDASGQGMDNICMRFTQAMGTAALSNIRVPGITTDDELLAVLELAVSSGLPTDRTSEASITSNGNIRLSTTSTASDQLIVIWLDKGMDRPAYNGSSIQTEIAAGDTATSDIPIPDIRVDDSVLWCLEFAATTAAVANRAASDTITIPSEGNIQLDTTDTSGDLLLVGYYHADSIPEVNESFNDSDGGKASSPENYYPSHDDRDFFCGAVVSGAAADTNIAVVSKGRQTTGSGHALLTNSLRTIQTEDTLLAVIELAQTSNIPTDRTKECSITSDGNIQCATATTDDKLIVLWHRAGGGAYYPTAIKYALATGAAADSDITVTGITTSDRILFALEHAQTSYDPTDRSDTCWINDTNDVQCSTTTADDTISIWWYDQSVAD